MNAVPATLSGAIAGHTLDDVIAAANRIILGKEEVIRLALACLLARGHLLIEDLPGVGKTTLAHVLARALGLSFQRIQFTSDMLPADILGASVYSRETGEFSFHPGPVFTQLILADEVNRATPRTQSALLEAMEERQVTVDGETRLLPDPFFVVATQNPSHQIGTFPLPESQLDRFMMCVHLGYPDTAAERELLRGRDRRELLAEMEPLMKGTQLRECQLRVDTVTVSDALLDYLQELLRFSRVATDFNGGLSPRAGLAIRRAAQAWALLHGRSHVLPEDVQAVVPGVIGHRLLLAQDMDPAAQRDAAQRLLRQVAIP
jgi:MoxR-like ATPase